MRIVASLQRRSLENALGKRKSTGLAIDGPIRKDYEEMIELRTCDGFSARWYSKSPPSRNAYRQPGAPTGPDLGEEDFYPGLTPRAQIFRPFRAGPFGARNEGG
jgi:hypothetical protein